mmetsp:Transcript_14317/g.21639  ORF Transcript_14317/g.21639 Transcript_14317/m.21639 type:complete len:149 (+) Transcript_14317:19-465(+)
MSHQINPDLIKKPDFLTSKKSTKKHTISSERIKPKRHVKDGSHNAKTAYNLVIILNDVKDYNKLKEELKKHFPEAVPRQDTKLQGLNVVEDPTSKKITIDYDELKKPKIADHFDKMDYVQQAYAQPLIGLIEDPSRFYKQPNMSMMDA